MAATKTNKIPTRAKTAMLKREIIDLINSGQYSVNRKLPSTGDLAKKFGISYVTAHRALNDLETDGVLERQNGRGTFIKQKYGNKIDKIGIPLRVEKNPFFAECYEVISRVADELDVRITFGSGNNEVEFINRLADDGVKAMLRFPGAPQEESAIHAALKKQNIRTVILNDWWQEGGSFPCVMNDEEQAVILLLDHLYELGHRKIALYQEYFPEARYSLMQAFNRWHIQKGLEVAQEQLIYSSKKMEHLRDLIQANNITAVIFSYDIIATQQMMFLHQMGVQIPGDLSIASMDNIDAAEAAGLTCTQQDVPALINNAFRLLMTDSYNQTNTLKLPATLFARTTTGRVKLK